MAWSVWNWKRHPRRYRGILSETKRVLSHVSPASRLAWFRVSKGRTCYLPDLSGDFDGLQHSRALVLIGEAYEAEFSRVALSEDLPRGYVNAGAYLVDNSGLSMLHNGHQSYRRHDPIMEWATGTAIH
jgi:hypothetical protein